MHPRRVGFGSTAAWARTGPRPIRLSSHFLPNALRVRQTTRSNRLPRRGSFTRKTRLSIVLSSRKTNGVRAMNYVQHLETDSVRQSTKAFASGENDNHWFDDYLRVELCPCCVAPAGDTQRRPSWRVCFRLYARAGFLHVLRVLEMQCFVLSYLLSTRPA